jgi:hypothetical protein
MVGDALVRRNVRNRSLDAALPSLGGATRGKKFSLSSNNPIRRSRGPVYRVHTNQASLEDHEN